MQKKNLLFLFFIGIFFNCIVTYADSFSGWKVINDNTYYYIDGILQKGITEINGNMYFLGERTGRLITTGWINADNGNTYYVNNKGIVQCPYNPSHHILKENLEKHKEKCPDRVTINSDLAKEMEAYIKGIKSGEHKKDTKNKIAEEKVKEDEKENNKNKTNEIIYRFKYR